MTNPAKYFPARLRGNLTTAAFVLATMCVVAIATMQRGAGADVHRATSFRRS